MSVLCALGCHEGDRLLHCCSKDGLQLVRTVRKQGGTFGSMICCRCDPVLCSAGLRADEAKSINMSLTMLGMCINARASSATAHAPYRDSKLTRLLKAR